MFWSNLGKFFGASGKAFGTVVGWMGGIGVVILIAFYAVFWLWPFRVLSNHLYDMRQCKKDNGVRYGLLRVLQIGLVVLALFVFVMVWYGLRGNLWGIAVVVLVTMVLIEISQKI